MSAPKTSQLPGTSARKRRVFAICGYALFAVGLVGTVLPVLPTTVFWVIAAICFARSSPAMYQRILNWPRIGPAVEDFVTDGVIKRRSKTIALSGMAVAAVIVIVAPLDMITKLASLAGIAVGAVYVVTRPGEPANEISPSPSRR